MTRVKFVQGQEKQFIEYALQILKINLKELAKKIKLDYELIKKYKQEKCLIDKKSFLKICKLARINPSALDILYFDDNWGQIKGGQIGVVKMREKYSGKLGLWRTIGGKNHCK